VPIYQAPVKDSLFLLNDVFKWQQYGHLPGFAEATPDVAEAIFTEAARLAEEVLFPLNMSGDREGCRMGPDATVQTPKGFKEAYKLYSEGGWLGLSVSPEHGGQGLLHTISAVTGEFTSSANMAFAMYPGLTHGAFSAIAAVASDDLKKLYLPKMVSGEWTGTMNLTEPHCGTDLGLLRTKAARQADGSYKITGQKIFISAGEHDLAENIVHLVLARVEGAPEGVKGISLFIVPKFIPDAKGEPGVRNGVTIGSLEHKMGIHANATCVMNYDEATGYLLGEENRGLRFMFIMMNEARLGVAMQGLSQSEVAYQNAAAYARDRLQMRSISGVKAPDKPADPIIVHPDVRRMLLTIRSFNEAARALLLWSSLKMDVAHQTGDKAQIAAAEEALGLLTPVLKGVFTDVGFDNTVLAQQVFGGHGYVGEWGVEQYVRDARIAQIYEGTNGIQALDLVGRKLPKDGGKAAMALFEELTAYISAREGTEALKPYIAPLKQGAERLQKATMWLMNNGLMNPDHAGAASWEYMHLFGTVMLGYMWAHMAEVALEGKASGKGDQAFLEAKLVTGRFFMERIMPETAARLARIESGADTIMALPAEAF
jgi:alkylation response protein AidB-like acyl-CoA dehydrogenase